MSVRLQAVLVMLVLVGLIGLYTREFIVLSNTINAGRLVAGSMVFGLVVGALLWYRLRRRFSPAGNHLPEILIVLVLPMLFMPLFASLVNRTFAARSFQSFRFISETPYIASGYGILRSDKLRPTGYYLYVQEEGKQYRFRYSAQAYYPITHQGDDVLLPVSRGLLGFRVVELR